MRKLGWLIAGIVLVVLLAGCGARATPVVIQEGAVQTQAAATAFYTNQTATADAALLPTMTPEPSGTPYARPTDDPAVDPGTVIATVAGHDITVEEFRNRVRYQRWAALETLRRIAETGGVSAIDIRDPENTLTPTIIGYLYTLSNTESFAEQVLGQMIQERVIHQEFIDRELDPNPALLNNLWARLLALTPTQDGSPPENLDESLDTFVQELAPYTAIGEVDLRFILTVQSEQQAVAHVVGLEVEVNPESLNVHLISVRTEAEAQEIIELLEDGADFGELARERSLDSSARGSGGDLGFIEPGQTVAAFDEAVFAAVPGEVVGPVQTQFGYHLIEVLEREEEVRARQILVETEEEAAAALERLNGGEDFAAVAAEMSTDPDAAEDGGDLGYIARGDMPTAIEDQLFNAETDALIGPIRTSDGYHILQVTDRRTSSVHARHILVETNEEADAVLERLNAGEDFADLANELSIDPGTQGNSGDLGFLTSDQMPETLADALYAADINEIVGPIEIDGVYYVGQVTETQLNTLSPDQYDELMALHFQNWLNDQIDAVEIDEVWREVYPSDPQPGDVAPYLAEMEAAMDEALQALATPTESSSPLEATEAP